jgi:hypothetical protein
MDRWWSQQGYVVLGPGTTTVVAAFDPGTWSDADGHFGAFDAAHSAGFWDAVYQGGRVGLTFGAGCFYGHGVRALGGTAVFTVLDLHEE